MSYIEKKPINRSKIRLFFGENYYKTKKYLYWLFSGNYYRKVFNLNNELINDEYICENHAFMMYQPYLSNE